MINLKLKLTSINAIQLKIHGSHFTCKVASISLNVRERVEVVEKNEDGPLPSPAVLWNANVHEKNPGRKKIVLYLVMYYERISSTLTDNKNASYHVINLRNFLVIHMIERTITQKWLTRFST